MSYVLKKLSSMKLPYFIGLIGCLVLWLLTGSPEYQIVGLITAILGVALMGERPNKVNLNQVIKKK